MTTREKIDLMTKINVANEQRIAEYLINGHEITQTSPTTLDMASLLVRAVKEGRPINELVWGAFRVVAEQEGYDPDIIENAVRSVGGQCRTASPPLSVNRMLDTRPPCVL